MILQSDLVKIWDKMILRNPKLNIKFDEFLASAEAAHDVVEFDLKTSIPADEWPFNSPKPEGI